MQSQQTFDEFYPGRPVFQGRERHGDLEVSTGSWRQGASDAHASPSSSPGVSQPEWAVMHPDHHDLEWHYCRGGWAG